MDDDNKLPPDIEEFLESLKSEIENSGTTGLLMALVQATGKENMEKILAQVSMAQDPLAHLCCHSGSDFDEEDLRNQLRKFPHPLMLELKERFLAPPRFTEPTVHAFIEALRQQSVERQEFLDTSKESLEKGSFYDEVKYCPQNFNHFHPRKSILTSVNMEKARDLMACHTVPLGGVPIQWINWAHQDPAIKDFDLADRQEMEKKHDEIQQVMIRHEEEKNPGWFNQVSDHSKTLYDMTGSRVFGQIDYGIKLGDSLPDRWVYISNTHMMKSVRDKEIHDTMPMPSEETILFLNALRAGKSDDIPQIEFVDLADVLQVQEAEMTVLNEEWIKGNRHEVFMSSQLDDLVQQNRKILLVAIPIRKGFAASRGWIARVENSFS